MKRISILVLALTLAACGSGGTQSGVVTLSSQGEEIFILSCENRDPSRCQSIIDRN